MDAEIVRLHQSIDGLTNKIEQVSNRQTSEFKELLDKLHTNYLSLVDRQKAAFDDFGDRLAKLLAKQEEQAATMRSEMKTDFSRIVDRQDSHFRWLAGLVIASAIGVGLAIYRAH